MARSVTPAQAQAAMNDGARYVDVRTVAEFEQGHPAGAYNVPLLVDGPRGRVSNASFVDAMHGVFATDAALVIGCLAATRSARAAALLEAAGFTNVIVQAAGWGGATDAFGRVTMPGWRGAGLPTATRAEPGRSWAEIVTAR